MNKTNNTASKQNLSRMYASKQGIDYFGNLDEQEKNKYLKVYNKHQLEEFANAFALFDFQQNGEITIEELGTVLRNMG